MSPLIGGDMTHVACGFAVLSACHQVCTYQSLRSVSLRTLNRHRLDHILHRFVQDVITNGTDADSGLADRGPPAKIRVLSPPDVAERESFLPFVHNDRSNTWLQVGCRLAELCPDGPVQFRRLLRYLKDEKYVLNYEAGHGGIAPGCICLIYRDDASGIDVIRGMLHAHMLHALSTSSLTLTINTDANRCAEETATDVIVQQSYQSMRDHADALLQGLEATGWKTDAELVSVDTGRGHRFRLGSFPDNNP